MRLHKYFLLGVTAIVAMAAMTGAALATTHTTTGLSDRATRSAGGGVKVAVANTALGRVLVDGRGHPLPVRKGQARQERLQREMRQLLAAADRLRQAARERRSKGLPTRNHEAHRRASAGHLQPSPALHLRQGHPEGSDEWRGARCLRCRVVRGLSRRRQGREGHQQWRRPIARRLRLLDNVDRGRNEPGPLTQIPGPLTCDRVGPGNPTKGQATCTIQTRRGSAPR